MHLKGREAREFAKKIGIPLPGNKMGAQRSRCAQGHFHASKGEAAYCNHLYLRLFAKDIAFLEIYPSIPLWEGRNYKADFRYTEIVTKPKAFFVAVDTDGNAEKTKKQLTIRRLIVDDFKGCQSRDFQLVKKAWPNYGRGLLRETRLQNGVFRTVREIEGKWKK